MSNNPLGHPKLKMSHGFTFSKWFMLWYILHYVGLWHFTVCNVAHLTFLLFCSCWRCFLDTSLKQMDYALLRYDMPYYVALFACVDVAWLVWFVLVWFHWQSVPSLWSFAKCLCFFSLFGFVFFFFLARHSASEVSFMWILKSRCLFSINCGNMKAITWLGQQMNSNLLPAATDLPLLLL